MKEILAAAIGIWLVFVLVFTSLVGAETGRAPTRAPIASTEVSGKINSVDPAGRTGFSLEDGTRR